MVGRSVPTGRGKEVAKRGKGVAGVPCGTVGGGRGVSRYSCAGRALRLVAKRYEKSAEYAKRPIKTAEWSASCLG